MSGADIQGVDYSEGRPDLGQLIAAGKTFVCRYLSGARQTGNGGKDLGQEELAELLAAPLKVVVVWETDGRTGPLAGAAGADHDGPAAVSEAQWLGVPRGACIYFAFDFDATQNDLAACEAYIDRLRDVYVHPAGYLIGDYGGITLTQGLDAEVDYSWQTYAWSGGQWDDGAVLRQYQNGVSLAGATVDLDEATDTDFGQFPQTPPPIGAGVGGAHLMYARRPDGSAVDFMDVIADGHIVFGATAADGTVVPATTPTAYANDTWGKPDAVNWWLEWTGSATSPGALVAHVVGTDGVAYVLVRTNDWHTPVGAVA